MCAESTYGSKGLFSFMCIVFLFSSCSAGSGDGSDESCEVLEGEGDGGEVDSLVDSSDLELEEALSCGACAEPYDPDSGTSEYPWEAPCAPDCPNVEWVYMPGGEFIMGTDNGRPEEGPAHKVVVKPFYIMRIEVTNEQFLQCPGDFSENSWCDPQDIYPGECMGLLNKNMEAWPVNCDIQGFCSWIGARLPTEAEWEYAARRGGKDFLYPWGNEEPSCERASFDDGTGPGCGCKKSSITRPPIKPVCCTPLGNTPDGLCDMAGNLAELVSDCYHPSYEGAPTDGSAWNTDCQKFEYDRSRLVLRGGSYSSGPEELRVTARRPAPDILIMEEMIDVGFRCVRSAE